jgi:hypothetical protein
MQASAKSRGVPSCAQPLPRAGFPNIKVHDGPPLHHDSNCTHMLQTSSQYQKMVQC